MMTIRGTLYIVSAPSGAGKTTLVRGLVSEDSQVKVSVSHTTRAMRPQEENGCDYHFVTKEKFDQLTASGHFLESAEVFGNWYGTSKIWLEEQLVSGFDIILEIDWQGARRVREIFSCISVFVFPPSKAVLQARLESRAQDDSDVIASRMAQAAREASHYSEYDYIIVNDDFDRALGDLCAIVRARRKKMAIQRERYANLVSELTEYQGD